ncbi:Uncharacterised protein [uncultured Roseburia sp.]|uniref:Chorion class high-cysteine HCB protein 13 n=1 Tax=Brotonthovivens ammoniilytica TaxID=2981725 RepID=A0ABT2TG31_9FIRM|nr:hypothetical protein [Brotonthovivens ammoniilytica]MCU6761155.1 hypothetical protein [Brotonthovivens ammoniilytica]SCI20509.1 Uncharacterised protein [uncultured Roseburia sp.]
MSDLAATNCGCDCGDNNGCGNLIWLFLILSCCGGNNGSFFNGSGCDNILPLLLILCCCGGNGGSFC